MEDTNNESQKHDEASGQTPLENDGEVATPSEGGLKALTKNKPFLIGAVCFVLIAGYLLLGANSKPSAQQCNQMYEPVANIVGLMTSSEDYPDYIVVEIWQIRSEELYDLSSSLPGRSGDWAREMSRAVDSMASKWAAGNYIGSSEETLNLFYEYRDDICPDLFE